MNLGYPLLSEASELLIDPVSTVPATPFAAEGINEFRRFIKPRANIQEQVYFHKMNNGSDSRAKVCLQNKNNGISLKSGLMQAVFHT